MAAAANALAGWARAIAAASGRARYTARCAYASAGAPAGSVPRLDRAAVWDGLVLKANNALPFVPSMTYCEVTQRYGDTVFDRDIDFRGERFTERITLEQPHRVTFTRIAGPVLGTIANEIEGPADDLKLRFSFALVVQGVEGGSAAEQEYADSMTGDYLKAVAATLNAMRRLAENAVSA